MITGRQYCVVVVLIGVLASLTVYLAGSTRGLRTRASQNEFPIPGSVALGALHEGPQEPAAPATFESGPAVGRGERLVKVPAPGEYVAFSLGAAERLLRQEGKATALPTRDPLLVCLGGINKVLGVVCDVDNDDLIVVGHHDPEREPLTIDDLAIALRSRFVHHEWPLVSIDAPPDVLSARTQSVRFEGGIENTQFGADLLDADFRMKRFSMGLEKTGVPGLVNRWDKSVELLQSGQMNKGIGVLSRYWFCPILPSIRVRDDVASIGGLRVGLLTEVMQVWVDGRAFHNSDQFDDQPSREFATAVTARFNDLARKHRSFSRLQGLLELVALAKAVEELRVLPDITYWLGVFSVKEIDLPATLAVLWREEEVQYEHDGKQVRGPLVLAGGVELKALALRVKAGDVTALRSAVLQTRPSSTSLAWTFIVDDWVIPTDRKSVESADFVQLLAHAGYLQRQKQFTAAEELYAKMLQMAPDFAPLLRDLGALREEMGDLQGALEALDNAVECDPSSATVYANRATIHGRRKDFQRALADHNKAIHLNPQLAKCYVDRGVTYASLHQPDDAVADFTKALEINPFINQAYYNRGLVLGRDKGQHQQAVLDFTRAIEINPAFDAAYSNRGISNFELNKHQDAIDDFNAAIQLDPAEPRAYYGRALVEATLGKESEAYADYRNAVRLGMSVPYGHEAFQAILPAGWQITRNPEPGLDVSATCEDLPDTYWGLHYQVMPSSAGDPPSDPRQLRAMERQFDTAARQNLVRPRQAELDPYQPPGRVLFNLAYVHANSGQEQFTQFLYSYRDGIVYVFRVSYPLLDATPSRLAIDSIFHTFVPNPGLKARSVTREEALRTIRTSLEGFVQSLPEDWRAELLGVSIGDEADLAISLCFQRNDIRTIASRACSVFTGEGQLTDDVERLVFYAGQAMGVAFADGTRTRPPVAQYAVVIQTSGGRHLCKISVAAANLAQMIGGAPNGADALRAYRCD